jgi:hypothetical protein
MNFKYSIHLINGQTFNTNHYDYSSNGNTIALQQKITDAVSVVQNLLVG